tara:strand:- start:135 stop:356 length:222 start_codon:yes stop_codon:yes gene_type:complete
MRFVLIHILAKRLGIIKKPSTPVKDLRVNEYTQEILSQLKFKTVGDVIEAYCLHHDTPGMGKKTWDDFFNSVC